MSRQLAARDGGVPFCAQVELTEGCSMRHGSGAGGLCHFCGLAALRTGPGDYRFLEIALAEKVATELGAWCPGARIEFALRGEPLMNPRHLEIFARFRHHLPRAQMMCTTNGDTLRTPPGRPFARMQARIEALFAAGLDIVLLDTYYPKDRRDALRAEAYALRDVTVADFYDDWVPQKMSPYYNHGRAVTRTVLLMDDLAARSGEHSSRVVKTHAGCNPTSPAPLFAMKRTCARPFREITMAWNGDVTLCCDDWLHRYVIGNATHQSLRDIWQHPRFEAARARLFYGDRDFEPCRACDAPAAPRFGLLPVYKPATPQDLALTAQVGAETVQLVPLWRREPTPIGDTFLEHEEPLVGSGGQSRGDI